MLNCSLHHQLYHHMHNYTDIAFKTPSRLRGLICIHALDNTCLSLLAANPLCLCFLLPPLCSHLVPSLSHPLLCVSFHLFCKIHIERFISIHFHFHLLLPAIQLNFLRAGSKTEMRRLIEKCLLLSLWCKTWGKACFFFNLSSSTPSHFSETLGWNSSWETLRR